jgi:nitroreductase
MSASWSPSRVERAIDLQLSPQFAGKVLQRSPQTTIESLSMMMRPNDTEIDDLIRLAGTAPSGGNTQPWKVRVRSDALELSLQPERAGSFLDVGHRGSVFSVGSFIENLCLASSWMGLAHQLEIHEFRGPTDPIATLRYLPNAEPPERDLLYEQITRRHTNRHLHKGPVLPDESLEAMRSSIRRWPLVRLIAMSELVEKKKAAALLGRGNVLLLQHPVLFSQMMHELRWSQDEASRSRDGVAISTLELPKAAVLLLRTLRKYPPLRKLLPRGALEKMPEPAVMGCSHLCVVSVRGALSTESLVNAGRALQRVWLQATALQLAVQPLATLPFLVLRAQKFDAAGLSASDTRELLALGAGLSALCSLDEDEFPLFIFRLSSPALAASDRALRLPHQSLYTRS